MLFRSFLSTPPSLLPSQLFVIILISITHVLALEESLNNAHLSLVGVNGFRSDNLQTAVYSNTRPFLIFVPCQVLASLTYLPIAHPDSFPSTFSNLPPWREVKPRSQAFLRMSCCLNSGLRRIRPRGIFPMAWFANALCLRHLHLIPTYSQSLSSQM